MRARNTTQSPSTAATAPTGAKDRARSGRSAAAATRATAKHSRKAATATPKPRPATAKQKVVRDSFTFPKDDYEKLLALKQRAVALGRPTKKGELLRAGIAQLAALDGPSFLAVVSVVPSVKTGRPKQEKPGSGRMPLH